MIHLDPNGIAWLTGTRTKVIEVVMDHRAHGWSAEEMHFQHPHLTISQIHAAMSFYYDNQAKVDQQIDEDLEAATRLSLQLSDPAFRSQLLRR
ncbi:MAG: DUF433 domain-containing protein [Acidobacteria bacterium]|nr:DUF433 domain-containing protein [Acidobacteriota bacterium]